jgi:conjugative relaxase-like TrwC/TraI family protein
MLRITTNTSSASAKSYYSQGLSTQDYYSEKEEIIGKWSGITAAKLGLNDNITKEEFSALCDNLNPSTNEQLTPRNSNERRVGYDFTFSANKSVSIIQALGTTEQKEEILNAFRSSVHETMTEIEKSVQTRVRIGGASENRDTANLVYGEFVHFTSRPIEGKPDMQLHSHCFVFNATFDEKENRFKAAELGQIKENAPYYEALFQSKFAEKIQDLGFEIERSKNGFEIKSINQNTIEKFSRRSEAIEKIAAEKGITSDKEKDGLGALTRQSKRKGLSPEEQKKEWLSRLSEGEKDNINNICLKASGQSSLTVEKKKDSLVWGKNIEAVKAVNYAIDHHLERKSVTTEKEILTTALKSSLGSATHEEIQKALKEKTDIIKVTEKGKVWITTKNALNEEKNLIKNANDFKGTSKPINLDYVPQNDLLTKEQKQAVSHALNSTDGLTIIAGKAGTGKTTLMKEVQKGIKKSGKQIFAFAPSAEASRDVQRKEGFENAETVAALIQSKTMQDKVKKGIIWIDEAGLLSNKDMNKIFTIAKNQNARIILTGDTKQHSSVIRGDALRIIQEKAGFRTSPITRIQRQKNEDYKQAVKLLGEGETEKGFNKLDKIGAIHQIEDNKERIEKVAADYVNSTKGNKTQKPKEVLVIAPTHIEGDLVTAQIREKLKAEKTLSVNEKQFTTYKNLQFTEAQKGKLENYENGNFLIFHKKSKGNIQSGSRLQIIGTNGKDTILLKGANNEAVEMPLDQKQNFNVFTPRKIELAEGDKIRITGNGKTLESVHLFNGGLYSVNGFDKNGNIRLSNGSTLSKEFGNFSHGYVMTSHASQGKTVDKVIISQSSESLKASSREQFYVSASRGRQAIAIYTDDKTELLKAVAKSGERTSAIELIERAKKQGLDISKQNLLKNIKDKTVAAITKLKKRVSAKPIITQNKIVTVNEHSKKNVGTIKRK